jgi:hypothetical protein
VANVQDAHPIIEHAIENPIGISDERNHADAWALRDLLPSLGMVGEEPNDVVDTRFNGQSDRFTK